MSQSNLTEKTKERALALADLKDVEWCDESCDGSVGAGYDESEASIWFGKHMATVKDALTPKTALKELVAGEPKKSSLQEAIPEVIYVVRHGDDEPMNGTWCDYHDPIGQPETVFTLKEKSDAERDRLIDCLKSIRKHLQKMQSEAVKYDFNSDPLSTTLIEGWIYTALDTHDFCPDWMCQSECAAREALKEHLETAAAEKPAPQPDGELAEALTFLEVEHHASWCGHRFNEGCSYKCAETVKYIRDTLINAASRANSWQGEREPMSAEIIAALRAYSSGETKHGEYNGDMEFMRPHIPVLVEFAREYANRPKPVDAGGEG